MSMREPFRPDPLTGFEKKARFQFFFWPDNKTFLLLTRQEQAICLQKLQLWL